MNMKWKKKTFMLRIVAEHIWKYGLVRVPHIMNLGKKHIRKVAELRWSLGVQSGSLERTLMVRKHTFSF